MLLPRGENHENRKGNWSARSESFLHENNNGTSMMEGRIWVCLAQDWADWILCPPIHTDNTPEEVRDISGVLTENYYNEDVVLPEAVSC